MGREGVIRERTVCEGAAWMVPPTFTAQHKGFYYDKARDRPVFYDRPEMAAAKETWRNALLSLRAQFATPVAGAVRLTVALEWPWPKSMPKWRRRHASPKVSAPDLDNILKGLLDVMTAMEFWTDDSQVAEIHAAKRYAERGAVRLKVVELVEAKDEGGHEAQKQAVLPGLEGEEGPCADSQK